MATWDDVPLLHALFLCGQEAEAVWRGAHACIKVGRVKRVNNSLPQVRARHHCGGVIELGCNLAQLRDVEDLWAKLSQSVSWLMNTTPTDTAPKLCGKHARFGVPGTERVVRL